MFTIQSAVTVVTAGIASKLFGVTDDIVTWSVFITIICGVLLLLGKYNWLDKLIKIIMVISFLVVLELGMEWKKKKLKKSEDVYK